MRLRADFSKREAVRPDEAEWIASPMAGVERRMLDRIGEEVARATSIVRYAPKSHFEEHRHDEGEEFLVLEGVFSDDSGDYGPGAYVRNPPGTAHAPWSEEGCTIFVKLRQFDPSDLRQFAVDTARAEGWQTTDNEGVLRLSLHAYGDERVEMLRLAAGTAMAGCEYPGGAEILVTEGTLEDEEGAYPAGSWLRLPPGGGHSPRSAGGCTLYLKTGHLAALAAA